MRKKASDTATAKKGEARTFKKAAVLPPLWHSMTENSPLPMVAVEGVTHIVRYVNPAFCHLVGKARGELIGKDFEKAVPEGESNRSGVLLEQVYRIGASESLADQEHTHASSHPAYWSYTMWAVLAADGRPTGVMIHITDTTEHVLARQHSEKIIEESRTINQALLLSGVRLYELTETAQVLNARLERAMQESHHRVKNNLQVISALVELQMGETGETANDEHLRRINDHIRALANIYDLLTIQAKEHTKTDTLGAQAILGRLIPMLEATSGGRRIKAQIADILLPVQQAASLSLLVSECISNAVKHATGEIEVTLSAEGSKARLEVCDDGSGFPPDFDWRKVANTGLSLIDSTTTYDLKGEVSYGNHSRGGGCVTVTFPYRAQG